MTDRLQVYNREGQLLTYIGKGHGDLPGQFRALVGVAIDKKNRVFTTEQYPGRMQEFRYVTDAEAAAEKTKRDEDLQKAATHVRRLPVQIPRISRQRHPRNQSLTPQLRKSRQTAPRLRFQENSGSQA